MPRHVIEHTFHETETSATRVAFDHLSFRTSRRPSWFLFKPTSQPLQTSGWRRKRGSQPLFSLSSSNQRRGSRKGFTGFMAPKGPGEQRRAATASGDGSGRAIVGPAGWTGGGLWTCLRMGTQDVGATWRLGQFGQI